MGFFTFPSSNTYSKFFSNFIDDFYLIPLENLYVREFVGQEDMPKIEQKFSYYEPSFYLVNYAYSFRNMTEHP